MAEEVFPSQYREAQFCLDDFPKESLQRSRIPLSCITSTCNTIRGLDEKQLDSRRIRDLQPRDQFEKFEERFQCLATALELVEKRSQQLAQRLSASETRSNAYAARLEQAQAQNNKCQERDKYLSQEVARLGVMLESQLSQAAFMEQHLQQLVKDEVTRSNRLHAQREDACLQRDEAMAELAVAYADIDAMQATLADSAVYVRQLRQRLAELEEQGRGAARQQQSQRPAVPEEGSSDVFSMASMKASIQQVVREAMQQEPAEQKRRIRQLQLRWHPDKNPVLQEFATEVTKLINEAVGELDPQSQ